LCSHVAFFAHAIGDRHCEIHYTEQALPYTKDRRFAVYNFAQLLLKDGQIELAERYGAAAAYEGQPQFSHCTVSVIVTCFVMGEVPEDVAVIVTVLEPTGVPGFEVDPPPLLLLLPQAVHQAVESVKMQTRPKTRALPASLFFLFLCRNTIPMKPGRNTA